jgi:hypothetical protein
VEMKLEAYPDKFCDGYVIVRIEKECHLHTQSAAYRIPLDVGWHKRLTTLRAHQATLCQVHGDWLPRATVTEARIRLQQLRTTARIDEGYRKVRS